ncbi:MAG: hypothetical protein FWD81_02835 [Methanomassiliicoccaceae archaeon]|nr:hypothetical protein [Methanomassiliicoccaceae archaeon]
MRATIRGSVFETNSSSSHTFIHVSKETYEAWKKGKVYLIDDERDRGKIITEGFYNSVYGERDFTIKKSIKELKEEGWRGTILRYKDLLEYVSELGYATVWKCKAKKEHIVEDWGAEEDHDCVLQKPYMEVIDNGRTVTVHIWGQLD